MARFPEYKELKRFEVVFFDLDNTIYPYEPAHHSALKHTLQQFAGHFQMDENSVSELYKSSRKIINERLRGQAASHSRLLYFKEMITGIANSRVYSDALKFEKSYWQQFLSEMKVDDEALQLIKKLHQKKVPMGIITDLTTQIQLQKMKQLKIEKYFSHVITSEEAGIEKPSADIFNFALEKFGVTADKSALIGDNIKTDGGAENIGIKCFIIEIS